MQTLTIEAVTDAAAIRRLIALSQEDAIRRQEEERRERMERRWRWAAIPLALVAVVLLIGLGLWGWLVEGRSAAGAP